MTEATTSLAPMEALLAAELPEGEGWQYEPKWDGFRCLARRRGDDVTLTSKSGKPLARYFPEVVAMLLTIKAPDFLLDGELIIPVGDALSFDALQLRLHPAESRIRKLSQQTPAELMAFDLLELDGKSLVDRPLAQRREALERFIEKNHAPALHLSPVTRDRDTALGWLQRSGGALDGVIANGVPEAAAAPAEVSASDSGTTPTALPVAAGRAVSAGAPVAAQSVRGTLLAAAAGAGFALAGVVLGGLLTRSSCHR